MAVSCDGPMAAYDERDPLTTVTKPLPSASLPLSTTRGDTRKASRPGMMVMAFSRGHHPPVASRPLSKAPRPRTMVSRPSTTVMTSRQSRIPSHRPHGRSRRPQGLTRWPHGQVRRHDPLTRSRIPSRRPHGRYDGPEASHYGRTAAYGDHNPLTTVTVSRCRPHGHSRWPPRPLEPKTVIFYQKREYARLPIGSGTGPNRPSGRKRLYVKVPHGS